MADTTWLQCVMPRPDWEKLNERRAKLGLKWSQILPKAVYDALKWLEEHPDAVAQLNPPRAPPAPKPAKVKKVTKAKKVVKPAKAKTKAKKVTFGVPGESASKEPTATELANIEQEQGTENTSELASI